MLRLYHALDKYVRCIARRLLASRLYNVPIP